MPPTQSVESAISEAESLASNKILKVSATNKVTYIFLVVVALACIGVSIRSYMKTYPYISNSTLATNKNERVMVNDETSSTSLIRVSQSATATTTQEVVTNDEYVNYTDKEFPISFEYPAEWGKISTSSFDIGTTQEDLDGPQGPSPKVKLQEIISTGHGISFTEKKCKSGQYCDIGIQVREYSTTTPLELDCSEGGCFTTDHINNEKYVKEHANISKNGIAWRCYDTYMPEGGNVARRCQAYHNNRSYELQMGYRLQDYVKFDSVMMQIEGGLFSMNELIGHMADPEDFKKMEERYEHILGSIVFN